VFVSTVHCTNPQRVYAARLEFNPNAPVSRTEHVGRIENPLIPKLYHAELIVPTAPQNQFDLVGSSPIGDSMKDLDQFDFRFLRPEMRSDEIAENPEDSCDCSESDEGFNDPLRNAPRCCRLAQRRLTPALSGVASLEQTSALDGGTMVQRKPRC
jgi:hypothetical protein